MRWDAFAAACPELAAAGEERLRKHELCLVGSLRRDGSPRISPVEPDFVDGQLLLGMIWQSMKARDLLRDPRCVIHSCTCDRHGTDGDFKLYGTATDVQDPSLRKLYRETIYERIGWAPEEPNYHLFAIEIDSAAFVRFGETEQVVMSWDPERGLRHLSTTDG